MKKRNRKRRNGMGNKDSAKQKHRDKLVTDVVYQAMTLNRPSEKALARFRRKPYEGLMEGGKTDV